jgi:Glu-tRNA(Gln) amidotransferase subunit E-like FAD-binding protein
VTVDSLAMAVRIGLEFHVRLASATKLFSRAPSFNAGIFYGGPVFRSKVGVRCGR